MTTRTWNGATEDYGTASNWMPIGAPQTGDVAVINGRAVTIGRSDLAPNVTLKLAPTSTSLSANLQSTTILPTDEVDILAGKYPAMVSVYMVGTVENFGTVNTQADNSGVAASSYLAIGTPNGTPGVFYNFGSIALENGTSEITYASADAGDLLVNDGVIKILRPGTDLVSADLFLPISGTGTIEIGAGTLVNIGGFGTSAGQTISFDQPGSSYSELTIEQDANIDGLIAGFSANDSILLDSAPYDTQRVSTSNGVTTLAFLSGGTVVRSLQLQGTYSSNQLNLSAGTSQGIETTFIRAASRAVFASAQPSTSPKVFRFVDTGTGTHFFTDDPTEAATVSSARSDLVTEGVGFNAIDPATNDPNAAPVYRFFDQIDGTHFFTASESEKAAVIATRPDLVFEPNSTFYEHATAQAGDVPVYRFFDSVHGTHFYTASSVEQAGIMASRPDLVTEGIAFYAPGS